jgi:hypothetical protein
MATSIHEGRLLTGRTFFGNVAVDSGYVRDVILNNLCHYADEFAQTRIAFGATSTALDDQSTYYESEDVDVGGGWVRVGPAFGPWSIPLRSDGSPYRLRVRVAGALAGSATITMRLVVGSPARLDDIVSFDTDYVFETGTVSLIPGWLTGSSQGTQAYDALIEIPPAVASSWITNVTTLDTVGGDEFGSQQCLVSARVYAKSTSGKTTARLYGLYVAEYVGLNT